MTARPIHDVQGFRNVLLQHVKYTACKRAIEEGRVEILGRFAHGKDNWWGAKVRSKYGKVWWFKVTTDETEFRYRLIAVSEINWAHWHGDGDGHHPVHDGEDPQRYYIYRLNEDVEWLDQEQNTSGFHSYES